MSHLSLVIPKIFSTFSLCQFVGEILSVTFLFWFCALRICEIDSEHARQQPEVSGHLEEPPSRLHFAHFNCFTFFWWAGSQTPRLLAPPAGRRGHPPHLLDCGSVAKLPLRAYGCLSRCSPAFARLFNLTVPLPAGDKMEKPCGGGLSQVCTHSQEYRISPRIPRVHFRYDPINVRILCLCLSRPAATSTPDNRCQATAKAGGAQFEEQTFIFFNSE